MTALHIDTYGDALLFGLIVDLGYLTVSVILLALRDRPTARATTTTIEKESSPWRSPPTPT